MKNSFDIVAQCKEFDRLHNIHLDTTQLIDIEIREEEKRIKGIEDVMREMEACV